MHARSGRGLGLLATQDISTGELILLSRPLGVAYGPVGSAPSNEAVVKAIIKAPLQPADLQWLKLLSASRAPQSSSESCISDARSRSSDAQADTLAAVADLLKQRGQQSPAATAGEQGFEASNVLQLSALPDQQLVAEAVSCNSYGEASEDIAVATLRVSTVMCEAGCWSPANSAAMAVATERWQGTQHKLLPFVAGSRATGVHWLVA